MRPAPGRRRTRSATRARAHRRDAAENGTSTTVTLPATSPPTAGSVALLPNAENIVPNGALRDRKIPLSDVASPSRLPALLRYEIGSPVLAVTR